MNLLLEKEWVICNMNNYNSYADVLESYIITIAEESDLSRIVKTSWSLASPFTKAMLVLSGISILGRLGYGGYKLIRGRNDKNKVCSTNINEKSKNDKYLENTLSVIDRLKMLVLMRLDGR